MRKILYPGFILGAMFLAACATQQKTPPAAPAVEPAAKMPQSQEDIIGPSEKEPVINWPADKLPEHMTMTVPTVSTDTANQGEIKKDAPGFFEPVADTATVKTNWPDETLPGMPVPETVAPAQPNPAPAPAPQIVPPTAVGISTAAAIETSTSSAVAVSTAAAIVIPFTDTPVDYAAPEIDYGSKHKCPVTGETVSVEEGTPALAYKGKAYYFCCLKCYDDFKRNPDQFSK